MAMQITKTPSTYNKLIRFAQILAPPRVSFEAVYCSTFVTLDTLDNEMVEKYDIRENKSQFDVVNMQNFMKITHNSVANSNNSAVNNNPSTPEEVNLLLENLMSKNKDKALEEYVKDCSNSDKLINHKTLKKLLRHYSEKGRPNTIAVLQNYCLKVDPFLYRRNGEFSHYMAKAQCMKGNPEKGLSLLLQSYTDFENMRSLYRLLFRELIHDTVLNRSEATLVIFKKYVLMLSNQWKDHYPLICFWHICWSSSWFSDQMFSNELLESSTVLQDIVRDRAPAFSITVLRNTYNDDAVVRLLQILIKYKMMTEYAKVLQILFEYKLKNRDIRGCTEIIKNCETLGISLPSNYQGRYIQMWINTDQKTTKPNTKTFKLKF